MFSKMTPIIAKKSPNWEYYEISNEDNCGATKKSPGGGLFKAHFQYIAGII